MRSPILRERRGMVRSSSRGAGAIADWLIAAPVPVRPQIGVIVRDNGGFECFVILGVLQRPDHGLGRKPMAHGVTAGMPLAFLGDGAGALRALQRLPFTAACELLTKRPEVPSWRPV